MRTLSSLATLFVIFAASVQTAFAQWIAQQEGRIYPTPNPLHVSDQFGRTLGLDLDLLVVGTPAHDPSGSTDHYGAAFVFRKNASGWNQESQLQPSSPDIDDEFGYAISVHAGVVAVGAHYDTVAAAAKAGTVSIFEYSGTWGETSRLWASDATALAGFGMAVALDTDRLAVGSPFRTGSTGATGAGAVYIFVRNAGQWTQEAKLQVANGNANDHFGWSLGLSGDRLIIGAPGADRGSAVDAGAAYVFERSAGVWNLATEFNAPLPGTGDALGLSVAIDGSTAIVGVPNDDDLGPQTGSAFILVQNGGTWIQQAQIFDFGSLFVDRFGTSVDIEGDRVLVGLPYNAVPGIAAGAAQLFVRCAGVWQGSVEMIGSDTDGNDFLGTSVALSGDLAASGATGAETPPSNLPTGEVYVFKIIPPPVIESYCTAKINSQGCAPQMSWTGFPSASNPNPFYLDCSAVLGFSPGLVLYGWMPASIPFQDGTLCASPPVKRTTGQNSLGNLPPASDCSGTFHFDFNALIQSGVDAQLVSGAQVYAQYWSRDVNAPIQTSLSDAVHFEIVP